MLNIQELTLDNGIPVIFIPMEGFQSYVQICAVGGGSRYETRQVNGISHLLEHMLFKGTKKRPTAQQIAVELENLGGTNNAFTEEEMIYFYVSEPGRFFRQVTDILSDQLINYTLNPDDLAREKGIVIEEMRMRKSDPTVVAFDMIPSLFYGDQLAGMTVIGTEEVVGNITREQLADYTKRYFNRKNMVIVVVGNLPRSKDILSILNEYYGAVPDGNVPRKSPIVKRPKTKPSIAIEKFDSPQTSFVLVMPSPDLTSKDLGTTRVLSTILGEGMSSRLFNEVREKRGLVYGINSYVGAWSDTGQFMIYGGASPGNIPEVLEVTKGQLSDLATCLVGEQELLKAKNIQEGAILRRMENLSRIASSATSQRMFLGRVENPAITLEKLRAISAEDVQRLAQEMFTNSNLHLVVVGQHTPQEEEKLERAITF
ncbi:MAG: hypothetical protein A3A00_02235 [Candidatus Spechtbacteria bacterium RIFCSPLOWO2_01_FULL_38_20]|nr:MAG: hypothetical protein A3A00_02235 [Candidatus Spechtbacteria bacterium RIFCSPLOWO2_01_FULL_38_20]